MRVERALLTVGECLVAWEEVCDLDLWVEWIEFGTLVCEVIYKFMSIENHFTA